jgi:hypothetical protein
MDLSYLKLIYKNFYIQEELKMKRFTRKANKLRKENLERKSLRLDETETNFMGGQSYKLNPIETLKIVAASHIFGEPQYYCYGSEASSEQKEYDVPNKYNPDGIYIDEFERINFSMYTSFDSATMFETIVDEALSYDFGGTLQFAVKLRNEYNMRTNPQIIMVRAAMHPKRKEFTSNHPGVFSTINSMVMSRSDEPMVQLSYFLSINEGDKSSLPSILKRSIAHKLSTLTKYHINKYKNAEKGMSIIDAVRITHATSPIINELMKTGKINMSKEEKNLLTWEQLRSAGKSWEYILDTINIGHMALLRNLRGIFTEISDRESCDKILCKLKNGVVEGKQFPYRYYSAYLSIEKCTVGLNFKSLILDALEECIDIATTETMPKLKGKTVCLSDNSASAWVITTTEYGTVNIAEIDNLSSVIAARCSDEGYVVKFGSTKQEFPISKRNGILKQAKEINEDGYTYVGGTTEGGIWEFFRDAINNKTVIDNIFIFSDQQAGTGGLYGTDDHSAEYGSEYGVNRYSYDRVPYINVFKLVQEYRKYVNPKVNVFTVATAGYTNTLLPTMSYRTSILTGWTGKEVLYAKTMIDQFDEIDNKVQNDNKKSSKSSLLGFSNAINGAPNNYTSV